MIVGPAVSPNIKPGYGSHSVSLLDNPARYDGRKGIADAYTGSMYGVPRWLADIGFRLGSKLNNFIFRSKPGGAAVDAEQGSWRFVAVGDIGFGSHGQEDVASRIMKTSARFVLPLGDIAYPDGSEKAWQKKVDPPNLFGGVMQKFPVYPVLGNHDIGTGNADAYFKRFPHLQNARYYSFDSGGVHFAALDSNEALAPGTDQAIWLEKDLAAAKDAKFRVVMMHHPLNSAQKRHAGSPHMANLGPLLAKHGVDLVLNGHDHWYERSTPLNGYGTVQVTAGGGGAPVYPFLSSQPSWSAFRHAGFGYLEVEVQRNQLVGRYVTRNGDLKDTFVLPARGNQSRLDAIQGGLSVPEPV